MATDSLGNYVRRIALRWLLCLIPVAVHADQVEMTNGDHYIGRVTSLRGESLVVQSDVLGNITLPRAKIASITFAPAVLPAAGRAIPLSNRSNLLVKATTAKTNSAPETSSALRHLQDSPTLLKKVEEQFLAGAGPEAQAKFNELMSSLISGKLDMEGLRAQARTTLDQARAAQKDLGEQGGSMMETYMGILDKFLKETDTGASPTNSLPADKNEPPSKELP